MKNKILIELRAAIDVSGNTSIPLCHGDKRTQQYVDGLKEFFKYENYLNKCDIVFVDNTLDSSDDIPTKIRECLSAVSYTHLRAHET